MSIISTESRPRYQIIADELFEGITGGRFPVGGMLPTEMELCAVYGVSRYTVRAALRQLREQGLVAMRRGSGTRVISSDPAAAYVQSVSSLSELLQYPDTILEKAKAGNVTLGQNLAGQLSLAPGSEWFHLAGLRRSTVSGKPICWQEIYVRPEYEATARQILVEPSAVHKLIEREHVGIIARAQLEMFASRIDKELARRLEVRPETAAMTIVRRYKTADDQVFETTVSVHPEDRFVYSLELKRDWHTE